MVRDGLTKVQVLGGGQCQLCIVSVWVNINGLYRLSCYLSFVYLLSWGFLRLCLLRGVVSRPVCFMAPSLQPASPPIRPLKPSLRYTPPFNRCHPTTFRRPRHHVLSIITTLSSSSILYLFRFLLSSIKKDRPERKSRFNKEVFRIILGQEFAR